MTHDKDKRRREKYLIEDIRSSPEDFMSLRDAELPWAAAQLRGQPPRSSESFCTCKGTSRHLQSQLTFVTELGWIRACADYGECRGFKELLHGGVGRHFGGCWRG